MTPLLAHRCEQNMHTHEKRAIKKLGNSNYETENTLSLVSIYTEYIWINARWKKIQWSANKKLN